MARLWRVRDGNNYYVARANALEDTVALYKTVNGVRSRATLSGAKPGTASTTKADSVTPFDNLGYGETG